MCDTTNKTDQKCDFQKHSWNVESLIEHIKQNMAWELSWEWWFERIVKRIWTFSSDKWREGASILENITDNLRENTDVSM